MADGRLSRNVQGDTTDAAGALISFGASSISSLPGGYARNVLDIAARGDALRLGRLATARGLVPTPEDHPRREVIERLMRDLAVDLGAVYRPAWRCGLAAFASELAALAGMERLGVVRRVGNRITVPEDMCGCPAGRASTRRACARPSRGERAGDRRSRDRNRPGAVLRPRAAE
ncbi:hypothetical protein [Methylobacterium frigidaeris]|uniref:Oxygen-independent coproporphyrinogen III oxidase n=1 Tax=Methylobacterium frigidaeris TaxID=2038277 RepID=A0AA37M8P5_9HYPH|nr:hypothetical protein [Methylobacterium frigidaeris]PIK68798.1 hypothetical protein CS379_33220 [Methylobacterium frigidaeris]GJD66399.1 Oxygen-independent coproporphyrinogen III oxidase [Methylobacterium frigidaeris]